MRNLARLTWRANKDEHGRRSALEDRRRRPICADPSCRKRVEVLPGGHTTDTCYDHMTAEQKADWIRAWSDVPHG